jgi:hypothetical protein
VLRTVTFSDAKVAEVVNANFVSAWFNRSPGFFNGDDKSEKSIFEHSNEAFLTKNICTFILTPEGRVFHYVAGYLSPELFLRFLDEAISLRRAGFDDRMKPKADGVVELRRIHAERAAAHEQASKTPGKACPIAVRTYHGVTHRHTEACGGIHVEAAAYFGRVHRFWEKAADLPGLEEIRYKYLYGNSFSEEGAGAQAIAVDPGLKIRG